MNIPTNALIRTLQEDVEIMILRLAKMEEAVEGW
jgi:hypothetical protein